MTTLITQIMNDERFISQQYLSFAKENKLLSNSQFLEKWVEEDQWNSQEYMVYFLYKENMNYEILKDYSPADKEVDIWAFIEYWVSWLFKAEVIDIDKQLIYIGFF